MALIASTTATTVLANMTLFSLVDIFMEGLLLEGRSVRMPGKMRKVEKNGM